LHSSRQKVPIFYNVRPFPTKLSLPMGRPEPPSNTWFLGLTRILNPNGISIGLSRFCTAHRRVSLYFAMSRPPPSKLPLHMRGCLHGSLGPPESSTQTTSRSVQPFLQGLLFCDRPTDRPIDHASRSVTVGRIYVRSTAMRPNKNKLRIITV